jgi:hypothetical protein
MILYGICTFYFNSGVNFEVMNFIAVGDFSRVCQLRYIVFPFLLVCVLWRRVFWSVVVFRCFLHFMFWCECMEWKFGTVDNVSCYKMWRWLSMQLSRKSYVLYVKFHMDVGDGLWADVWTVLKQVDYGVYETMVWRTQSSSYHSLIHTVAYLH